MKTLIIFFTFLISFLFNTISADAQISGPDTLSITETGVYEVSSPTNWTIENYQGSNAFIVGEYSGVSSVTVNAGTFPGLVLLRVESSKDPAFIYILNGPPLNSSWRYVGAQCFDRSSTYLSLAFDGSTPYIAYKNYDFETSVVRFDGTSWIWIGSFGLSGVQSNYQSLAFDGSTPYVAYSSGSQINVLRGFGWTPVGTPNALMRTYYGLKFKVSEGVPYIAFGDNAHEGKLTVMKFDGSDWIYVGTPGFSNSFVGFPEISLAIESGIPYVAYSDYGNGYLTTVKKFDGINWVNVGSLIGYSQYSSFIFNEHIPYLAFGPNITVLKFNGTDWENIGTPGFSGGQVRFVSLAFNGNTPYVAFEDFANGHRTSVMKFDGTNWIYYDTPGFSYSPAIFQSLAFNGNTPYVAFSEVGNRHGTSVMKFEDHPLPVELSSLTSSVNNNNVNLKWATASETNNSGFDIERSNVKGQTSDEWTKISFIQGHGTTSTPNNYEFTDNNLTSGKYKYRLKQIDFNGNYEYYNLSDEVVIGVPEKFELSQNYPNPFNPVTNLEFGISDLGFVSLKVYDVMGKEVATLVNEIKPAGRYEVTFDGSNVGSGIYFYKIEAGSFSAVKKMLLIK